MAVASQQLYLVRHIPHCASVLYPVLKDIAMSLAGGAVRRAEFLSRRGTAGAVESCAEWLSKQPARS